MTLFIQAQNQKQLSIKVLLIMYLNQSILQLYQTCKISLEKGSCWIIDSVIDHNISILNNIRLAGSSYIKLPKELTVQEKD